ncbi:MAG: hypothetical protein WB052_12825, partial [Pseudolabrys sp.]
MSKLLSHSDYWRLQAQEARLAAQRTDDLATRADLLAKADEYDRRAACNREWEAGCPLLDKTSHRQLRHVGN